MIDIVMAVLAYADKLIPYAVAIVEAKTVREKVVAVYDLFSEVSKLTPTPVDNAVVKFIDGQPGRLDAMVDLIVEGLDLLGFEDGENRPGPFGSMSAADTTALEMALAPKAKGYGVSVVTLITAIRAVKLVIEAMPNVIEAAKRLWPNLFGKLTEDRQPVTPTVVESVNRDGCVDGVEDLGPGDGTLASSED